MAARDAAIRMALVETVPAEVAWKLGVRVFPDYPMDRCYRCMMLLVHPDKNENRAESVEAAKALTSIWAHFSGFTSLYRHGMATADRNRPMTGFEKDLRNALQKAG